MNGEEGSVNREEGAATCPTLFTWNELWQQ